MAAKKGEETRYLVRTLCQNLRVGAVRTSILTALARAVVLTPPTTLIKPPLESAFYSSAELLRNIKPLPPDIKKALIDFRRDELSEKCITAEALIRKVYVQRPNYDDIVRVLLEVGLDGLAEHLPLTVGEYYTFSRISELLYRDNHLSRNPATPNIGFSNTLVKRNL